MKPQFSWADTDVEPTAANSAAAAIAIVGRFIDMEGVTFFLIAWCKHILFLSDLLVYIVMIYILQRGSDVDRLLPAIPIT